MVDISVIQQRLSQLEVSLKKIERYKNFSLLAFLDDDRYSDSYCNRQ